MLGWLEWRWLGDIYSPQPPIQPLGQATVDGRTGQSGAPSDTVRCASHVTQPLGFWRFRPLELCLLVAPDSSVSHRTGTVHCPVRLWRLLWLLRELSAHCSVAGDRCRLAADPLRWLVVAPLVHRTVRWIIADCSLRTRRWRVRSRTALVHRTLSGGTPDTHRFLLLLSFEP
jgi:hypothetical protein